MNTTYNDSSACCVCFWKQTACSMQGSLSRTDSTCPCSRSAHNTSTDTHTHTHTHALAQIPSTQHGQQALQLQDTHIHVPGACARQGKARQCQTASTTPSGPHSQRQQPFGAAEYMDRPGTRHAKAIMHPADSHDTHACVAFAQVCMRVHQRHALATTTAATQTSPLRDRHALSPRAQQQNSAIALVRASISALTQKHTPCVCLGGCC